MAMQNKFFMQIKVFILGDVRLHREGLALQLEGRPNVKVIGAGILDDAVRLLRSTPADVTLLDSVQLGIPTVVDTLRRALRRLRIVAMGVREVERQGRAWPATGVAAPVADDAAGA